MSDVSGVGVEAMNVQPTARKKTEMQMKTAAQKVVTEELTPALVTETQQVLITRSREIAASYKKRHPKAA